MVFDHETWSKVLVAVFVTFAAVAFAVMLFSLENDLDTKQQTVDLLQKLVP